jgi:hypothetical protein
VLYQASVVLYQTEKAEIPTLTPQVSFGRAEVSIGTHRVSGGIFKPSSFTCPTLQGKYRNPKAYTSSIAWNSPTL